MTDDALGVEILASWDGPAEHAPGVLLEEFGGGSPEERYLSDGVGLMELTSWLALSAASGIIGNAAFAGVRAKVLGVLTAWRYQWGQDALDDLERRVFDELNRYRDAGKLTEDELRGRVARFFAEIWGS